MTLGYGVTQVSVQAADFEMTSRDPRRIILPYKGELWGNLLTEAVRMIVDQTGLALNCGEWRYDKMVRRTGVEFLFNVQSRVVRAKVCLRIETMSGKYLTGRIAADMDVYETEDILEAFFAGGGKGVKADFLRYFMDSYEKWKAGQKKLKLPIDKPKKNGVY